MQEDLVSHTPTVVPKDLSVELCQETFISQNIHSWIHKDHQVQLLSEWPIPGSNPQPWCYLQHALTGWTNLRVTFALFRKIIKQPICSSLLEDIFLPSCQSQPTWQGEVVQDKPIAFLFLEAASAPGQEGMDGRMNFIFKKIKTKYSVWIDQGKHISCLWGTNI